MEVRTRLGPLAVRWDELVDRLPLPSPFLRSWWLEHTAGRRPRFVLVMEDGALLGVPRLRVMGAGALCPDHLDAVVLPGREADVLAGAPVATASPADRLHSCRGRDGGAGRRCASLRPWPGRPAVTRRATAATGAGIAAAAGAR